MQSSSRMLEDLARVAGGAVSTLVGIKGEIEAVVRQQIERLLTDADMVPRDEFDAVKAMARKARSEQEKLEKRVAKLEAGLGVKPARTTRPAKPAAKAAGRSKAAKATVGARKSKPAKARKTTGSRREPTAKGARR